MSDLEAKRNDEGEDVEGHSMSPNVEPDREAKESDEGDDVEAHSIVSNIQPNVEP